MAPTDPPIEILIQIRDELKRMREELSSRLDQTSSLLDQTNSLLARFERRQTESEVRLASELVNLVSAGNQRKDLIVADWDLRRKVEEHDRRIALLEEHAH